MIQMVSATEVKKWKCIQKILVQEDFGHKSYVQERLVFFCKRVVQGFVVCLRYVQSCAREILSRELCKNVFLPERCQKLRKRDYFKRVLRECFFAREMSKAVQEKFFQESCARVIFFCQRDVQGCTRFIVVLIVAQKRDSHIFVSSEHS
jgi:hypothetical protein